MMLAVENHRGSFLAPLGIGISLFLGHMIGTLVPNYSSLGMVANLA